MLTIIHWVDGFCCSCSVTQSYLTLWTPWIAAHQASLSFIIFWRLLKQPSNHLNIWHPHLLPSSILPSFRIISNKLALHIRWPKYWSFSLSISPPNEYAQWYPLGWTGWISLQSKGLSRVFFNTTVQKHQFFTVQPFLWSNSHIHIWLLEKP